MNESILNALLQLFAIIANVDKEEGLSFRGRNIVKSYLSQHLNSRLTNKYLRLFDHYIKENIQNSEELPVSKKHPEEGINKQKVEEICGEVNKSLVQREKFIVFFRLLEFINEDEIMTDRELDFVHSVAGYFNITDTAFHNTKAFIVDPFNEDVEKKEMLIIGKKDIIEPFGIKCIFREDLDGHIVFLHHAPTNTFVFKYSGESLIYLNGEVIIPGRVNILDQGALITGPMIKPIYYSDILGRFFYREDVSGIKFVAENIEFRYRKGKNGIKPFNLSEESGTLVGIMGGSGVGKSTLLNILSGKVKPHNGHVFINGYDIHKDKDKLTGLIGYVPQDDLLMEELTVFQNLYFNARLCFSDLSEKELIRKVIKTLADLELEDVKDLKVGNPLKKYISGGQRKRLNFALELIREPAILFIDEPTSGLSSMDSEKVMLLLKEQTLKNKLIFVNIHQPFSDIYKLFDKILILDKGGYPIYNGNPIDALTYFKSLSHYVNAEEGQCISCGNVTPEEILRIVEAKEIDEFGRLTAARKVTPHEWYGIYRKEIESKSKFEIIKETLPKIISKIPNAFVQFNIFITRNLLSKLANSQYMLINFLEAPLLALIIGFFTKYVRDNSPTGSYIFQENENLPAYLFMAVVVALFMGLMVSAEEIIRDRKILERESFLNLNRLSYLNSKVVLVFLISAIQTYTFVLVANTILGIKDLYFSYWMILFSTSCLANMIGLNISSGLNSVITIYILIPFILVPQLLLSGVVVDFDRLNKFLRHPVYVPLIGDVMPSRWSYEALAVNQFKNNNYDKIFFPTDKKRENARYQILYLIPTLQGRVNETLRNTRLHQNTDRTKQNLSLLSNELRSAQKNYSWPAYENIGNLTMPLFDSAVSASLLNYFENVKGRVLKKETEATRESEKIINTIYQAPEGKENLIKLKLDNHNNKLSDQLTNKMNLHKIIELNNHLVRKIDPVYMDPLSHYGRAHLYAPVKRIGNLSIETVWFNILVLWIGSFILYVTLVFDLLRKFMNWSERFRLREFLKIQRRDLFNNG